MVVTDSILLLKKKILLEGLKKTLYFFVYLALPNSNQAIDTDKFGKPHMHNPCLS